MCVSYKGRMPICHDMVWLYLVPRLSISLSSVLWQSRCSGRPNFCKFLSLRWTMGAWLSRSVEIEYEGKNARFSLPLNDKNETDLAKIYEQLMRTFNIPLDTNITGFVCDTQTEGPICPFRLIGGLRGECVLHISGSCSENQLNQSSAYLNIY